MSRFDRERRPDPHESPSCTASGTRALISQLLAFAAGLAIAVWGEIERLGGSAADGWNPGWWLADMNVDSTPYLMLLLVAPLFWFLRTPLLRERSRWTAAFRRWFGASTGPDASRAETRDAGRASPTSPPVVSTAQSVPGVRVWRAWVLAGVVAATSLAMSAKIAATPVGGDVDSTSLRFGELPPAYHDEYSYRLQAETFLAGRLSYPSHAELPRLFDQVHVVNEGRFASRYFPATGAWMAPFLALGNPVWGHWLAGALTAMFIFWAGRELGGNGVGFLAGMLTALSPGMGLFSNLLLAHHPTLVGLTLFLFTFLRMLRTRLWLDALLAGTGLSFAMLARPMTAAGFGLPFGIWFVCCLLRGGGDTSRPDGEPVSFWGPGRFRLKTFAAMVTPIVAGLAFLPVYNRAITADPLVTPYEVFQTTYTPRHVYGFNNVVRAEEKIARGEALTNDVFDNYDRWAENLTPKRALENVENRLLASWQWTLGIVPLVMAAVAFAILAPGRVDRRWWLIVAAIVSLHAAHVPYWYDGIMHWHYVFETGPLWLLLFAGATQLLAGEWRLRERRWMPLWWAGLVAVPLTVNHTSFEPFWPVSRTEAAVAEIAFSRRTYHEFRALVERRVTDRPALVLIVPDPADRHIDYVMNRPGLGCEILYGRFLPERMDLHSIREAFPERRLYLYRAEHRRLQRIEP